MTTVLLVPLLVWWVLSPAVALAIGWRRGRPLLGWLCGLVPMIGPWLASRLIPQDHTKGDHQ
jgi:hypothetical protein